MTERQEYVHKRRLTEVLRKLSLQKEKEEHAQKMKEFEEMRSQTGDVFRIAICGKFKTGKTSLLNLLLGLDLPVMAVTATGVVTKIICHGSMAAEFEDGSRKEISKSELNQYITVAGKDLDGIKYSDAVSVEVPCESPLMMNGKVEFWDTPGLEDDRRLTEITMNAVKKCDLAVLVMNAAQLLSQKEKMFLYQMQEMLGGNVLVVINRWDMLREDEKPGVRKTVEVFLKKFGNDLCGYGRYLMTSANPTAPYIDSLRNRLYDICENEKMCREYSDHTRRARIDYFVREWDELLGQDIDRLQSYLKSRENTADEEERRRTEELKKDYREKREQVKSSLSELMCKVDDRSYWTDALKEAKNTAGWETQYVRLSTGIMKKSLRDIYQKARAVTGEHFAAREYPECYPLPTMSEENVWEKMTWGEDFHGADEFGGVMAGAAAGAVVGSVIPIVGTFSGAILGAGVGIFRGISRENKAEKAEQAFKSSCINKTVTAFYKEPSMNAKKEIQNYMDELFRRIEKCLPQKCGKIRDELAERAKLDSEYHESSLLLDELLKYRKKLRYYSETSNLKFQVQKLKFFPEDEEKMQHMNIEERIEYIRWLKKHNMYVIEE